MQKLITWVPILWLFVRFGLSFFFFIIFFGPLILPLVDLVLPTTFWEKKNRPKFSFNDHVISFLRENRYYTFSFFFLPYHWCFSHATLFHPSFSSSLLPFFPLLLLKHISHKDCALCINIICNQVKGWAIDQSFPWAISWSSLGMN